MCVVVGVRTLHLRVKLLYDGRVFAIDVPHHNDYLSGFLPRCSEGLLIEHGRYYRVLKDEAEAELSFCPIGLLLKSLWGRHMLGSVSAPGSFGCRRYHGLVRPRCVCPMRLSRVIPRATPLRTGRSRVACPITNKLRA